MFALKEFPHILTNVFLMNITVHNIEKGKINTIAVTHTNQYPSIYTK